MAPRGPVRVAICGPPGAGKTALARAAASAAGVGPVGHGADLSIHARRHHDHHGWGRNARSTAPPATIPAHVAGPDDDDDRAVILLDTPGWAPSSGGGGGANGTVPVSCPPLASLVPHLRGVARHADVVVLAYDAGGTTREVSERIDALGALWLPALREALRRPRRRARASGDCQPSEREEEGDDDDDDDEGTRRIPVVVAGCRRDARRGEDASGRTPVTNGANGNGRSDDDAGRADGAPSADKPKKPKPNLKPNPKPAAPGASNDANGGDGGGDDDVDVGAALLALMDAWREIESCVECSARTGFNALKTVRLARRGAIFPAAPLLRAQPSRDPSSSPGFAAAELSARCTRALADVFHAHDVDGDGALADVDLARMQRRGFGVAPAPGELDGLKRTCADATNGAGVVTLADGDRTGLTLRGFLYAHGLFVAKGRAETTWTLLRAHGYDDNLEAFVDDDDDGEGFREDGLRPGDGEARGFPSKTAAVDVAACLAAGAVLAGAAVFAFRTTGGRDARGSPGGFSSFECTH